MSPAILPERFLLRLGVLRSGAFDWFLRRARSGSRFPLIIVILGLCLVVGVADYLTGFELSFLSFYILPVCLAVAVGGWRFGVGTALLCILLWLLGDLAAGALYASKFVPLWNALIALCMFLFVIWLFAEMLRLHRNMEERVRQRTVALREEIAEREYLEKVVIDIGDRERCSIGHDLHDGLGQHLTGTALVTQALAHKAATGQTLKPEELRRITRLIEEAIDQTRSLAKGLLLAEIQADGLVPALQEMTTGVQRQHAGLHCEFQYDVHLPQCGGGHATHLYRIAHEAVRNAVRHGRASHIVVSLLSHQDGILLRVRDDGIGIPSPEHRGEGLGLRIMGHRASILRAEFRFFALPEGGSVVECNLPASSLSPRSP